MTADALVSTGSAPSTSLAMLGAMRLCVAPRRCAIDSRRMLIRVEKGKGGKAITVTVYQITCQQNAARRRGDRCGAVRDGTDPRGESGCSGFGRTRIASRHRASPAASSGPIGR